MLPRELKPEHFNGYPPQARDLAKQHVDVLRQIPLVFLPILLREMIDYDWRFPAERKSLESQIVYLESLTSEQRAKTFSAFAQLTPPSQLERSDWVNQPSEFELRLTAWLWSTHQMDAFQAAAKEYAEHLQAANPEPPLLLRHLGIVLIGQGVERNGYPLFRKLQPHGVHFTQVNSENGLALLQQAVAMRARTHPVAYGHWYIDGGPLMEGAWEGVTCVSYSALEPMRAALLRKMQTAIQSGDMGPEALRTMMLEMQPGELGANEPDPIFSRFQMRVLTEGSGTQIFSTSFVQWAAREALRRAQPVTLLVRFAPRQRQRSMDEMLSGTHPGVETDPAGSLVDADMGAYYTWINQQRLSHATEPSFLVWFEGHNEAMAIGPSMPRGTRSSTAMGIDRILGLLGGS
jgi:hypothetical protein